MTFIFQKELKSLEKMLQFVYLSQESKSIRDNGSNMQHTFREVNEDNWELCFVSYLQPSTKRSYNVAPFILRHKRQNNLPSK